MGKLLEAKAKAKASEAITKFAELQPSVALRLRSSTSGEVEERVHPALLEVGDRVRVPQGGRIPSDGTVVE